MPSLLAPEERVLSTLNADGSRRWLDPAPVTGWFRKRRKAVGWILIAIFVTLPHLHANGKQLFFANFAEGEFTFFGLTFLRTDTLLFALTLISIFVAIFLVTAVFGRIWCGWACPQTVYLEFVFRPIATFFNGKGKRGLHGSVSKLPRLVRSAARWLIVLAICFALSNTFLAYFAGSRTVLSWSTQPPWVHPAGFLFVCFVTALMVADFGFFREQLCFIACPYGRFQSVMLDRNSLIVGYDEKRGEPRGKLRKPRRQEGETGQDLSLKVVQDADESPLGDCVACNRCVAVCPTGIDIRDGLQMECIHCARCIDACDAVMEKVGRPKGLIRYSSQNLLSGERASFIRPRVVIYPIILAVVLGTLLTLATTHAAADIRLIRERGQPFFVLPTGEVSNQIRLRVTNRTGEPRTYAFEAVTEGVRIEAEDEDTTVGPGETRSFRLLFLASQAAFASDGGVMTIPVRVTDDDGFEATRMCRLLGPLSAKPASATDPTPIEGETP